jgi:hypothetical protein
VLILYTGMLASTYMCCLLLGLQVSHSCRLLPSQPGEQLEGSCSCQGLTMASMHSYSKHTQLLQLLTQVGAASQHALCLPLSAYACCAQHHAAQFDVRFDICPA